MLTNLGERGSGGRRLWEEMWPAVSRGAWRCSRGARLRRSRWLAVVLAQRAMEEEVSGHDCGASQAWLRKTVTLRVFAKPG